VISNGNSTISANGKRTDPDVAFDADPATGISMYDSVAYEGSSGWQVFGGTSIAAPQWAGLVAIADQGRAINGESSLDGPSQLLPMIYQMPSADFHDITSGASTGSGSTKYSPGPGYDLVTGRGSPIANLVVNSLVGTNSWIVANGQSGFLDTGTWASYPEGYTGNLLWTPSSGSSTPTATASWQVTGLQPGTYTVAATWDTNANHATNAPYSIYDGSTLLTTVDANQTESPVGATAGGVEFQTLATVTVDSGTLNVVLGNNANGVVVANAIEVSLVGSPTIDLNWTGGGISGSPATIAAATPFQVSSTYTITNTVSGGLTPVVFSIGYYASTNGQLSGATLLGRQIIAAGQAAGTYTVTSPSLQFPTAGNYYLLADLNDTDSILETNTSNNLATAAQEITVGGATIVANGQAGFSDTGIWASYGDGYNGNLLWTFNSEPRPTATASWQVTELAAGSYTVAATWDANANHATNAPYSIYDGSTLLDTVYADQSQSPVGTTAGGVEFQTLATVTVDSGTLTVMLGNNANGVVVANAIEVTPAAAPTIDLNWTGGGISGSPTSIAAATPFQVSSTYTITNTVSGGVTPNSFTIGYYASTNGQLSGATLLGQQIIAAGQAAGTYTVPSPSLQFPTAGTYYLLADLNDTNSIVETNTANNVTAAAQQVTVTGSFIVANGQAGFTDTGTWYSYPDGYSGNLQWSYNSGSSTPTATASWQVTELAPGTYTVAATWDANANHATNAPFSIYDGNTLLTTVTADQSQTPVGTTAGGVVFQTLTTVTVSSGTLTVVLGNNADGVVVANAIEITLV
jgi:uncharacterized protein (DUF2141 family)